MQAQISFNDRKLQSSSLDPHALALQESLLHLANGQIGLRANFAEYSEQDYGGNPPVATIPGCYLNGYYENVPMIYPEAHVGFPSQGERMVTLPDIKYFRLKDEKQFIHPLAAGVTDYQRELDMRAGFSTYQYRYQKGSAEIRVQVREMLSFSQRELFLQEILIEAEKGPLHLEMEIGVDPEVYNKGNKNDPRVAANTEELLAPLSLIESESSLQFFSSTKRSKLSFAGALQIINSKDISFPFDGPFASSSFDLAPGEELRVTRYCCLSDQRHVKNPRQYSKDCLEKAVEKSFDEHAAVQKALLDEFWEKRSVTIKGDPDSQNALDFTIFTLLQSAPDDGICQIPAKGLSGQGYEGHYFWDFEVYFYPFYLWTWPERAKLLLLYRYSILDQARENAKILGYKKGAQFSWRSISGPECSGYYPSGNAQLHINADIAHAFMSYYRLTGDLEFMLDFGFEVLLETARTWLEVGSERDGKFMIFGVTGPDEYSCMVDNNYYTNRAAQANLYSALEIAELLKTTGHGYLLKAFNFTDEEAHAFRSAADKMLLPYDEELGINAQDDSFLKLPRWDLAATPKEDFPLLLHYAPTKLYRYQVLKQADTTLAHFLYEKDPISERVIRSRHYYEELTTHDSSLSACIYGSMAALAGEVERAKKFFEFTRDTDLQNLQGNTADGLHLANLAGVWLFIVQGYMGLRLVEDEIILNPHLPSKWEEVELGVLVRGSLLKLHMDPLSCEFDWQGKETLAIRYAGEQIELAPLSNSRHLRYKGLLFDLDGVLCHTDHLHYKAWKALADREGIEFNPEINQRLRGVSRMESLEIILERAEKEYTEAEKEEMASAKNQLYRSFLAELRHEDVPEREREILQALRNAGYRLAIGSSSKNARFILEQLELTPYFEAIVDGTNIQRSKPDPQVFQLAAQALDLAPDQCLVIEDAESGLQSARAAGSAPAGFGPAAVSPLAYFRWQNLEDLADALLSKVNNKNE